MTEGTSAPVSSVSNVTANSPKKPPKNHQKANQHKVHHIQNILI